MDDMEFVALMFYSAMAGATRAVLEAGRPAKMVVQFREELLVLCSGYVEKSARSSWRFKSDLKTGPGHVQR